MEMSDLQSHLAKKLESQPSVSNAGIYAQQADYRTEFWRKGLGEMDLAIEIDPKRELPYRFVAIFRISSHVFPHEILIRDFLLWDESS